MPQVQIHGTCPITFKTGAFTADFTGGDYYVSDCSLCKMSHCIHDAQPVKNDSETETSTKVVHYICPNTCEELHNVEGINVIPAHTIPPYTLVNRCPSCDQEHRLVYSDPTDCHPATVDGEPAMGLFG
jgi:hypothetical protein